MMKQGSEVTEVKMFHITCSAALELDTITCKISGLFPWTLTVYLFLEGFAHYNEAPETAMFFRSFRMEAVSCSYTNIIVDP
jgi:hypothetical protein